MDQLTDVCIWIRVDDLGALTETVGFLRAYGIARGRVDALNDEPEAIATELS